MSATYSKTDRRTSTTLRFWFQSVKGFVRTHEQNNTTHRSGEGYVSTKHSEEDECSKCKLLFVKYCTLKNFYASKPLK